VIVATPEKDTRVAGAAKPSEASKLTKSSEISKSRSRAFSTAVLKWFDTHGRKHLPWQQNPTPYQVWVSEIMLQQTQVTTVIPYFENFTQRFESVESLACASQDEVLSHWSGLGYYARGRNLHRAALQMVENYGGQLPSSLDELIALPGIGRSTAGAIMSLGFKQAAPILDGNVKRVLCRYFCVDGWPAQTAVERRLWTLTTALTPLKNTGKYNQAMMDLGATVCTRKYKPAEQEQWGRVKHSFTHYDLHITPVKIALKVSPSHRIMEETLQCWVRDELPGGCAAPVKRLLETLNTTLL